MRSALFAFAVGGIVLSLSACAPNGASAGVEAVSASDGRGDPASDGSGRGATRADLPISDVLGETGGGAAADATGEAGHDEIVPLPIPLPATVAVVGDSLTLSATDEIDTALTGLGLDVLIVDGLENRRMVRGGRDLPPGVDAIEAILEFGLEPELWIVALGTNDVGSGVEEARFRDDVAAVLTRIPPATPVIWIDLWIRDRADEVAEANQAIRSVTALRPATVVVDWFGHGDDPGVITRDGVHLTDAGRQVFATTMASAVDTLFAG